MSYSQIPRNRGTPGLAGPHEKARGLVRRQRGHRKPWARAFVVVSMGRMSEQGKQA